MWRPTDSQKHSKANKIPTVKCHFMMFLYSCVSVFLFLCFFFLLVPASSSCFSVLFFFFFFCFSLLFFFFTPSTFLFFYTLSFFFFFFTLAFSILKTLLSIILRVIWLVFPVSYLIMYWINYFRLKLNTRWTLQDSRSHFSWVFFNIEMYSFLLGTYLKKVIINVINSALFLVIIILCI